MFFSNILDRENAFLRYKKKRSSKSQKIDIFPKGLTHGFGPKIGHFFNFLFLGNIGQENLFYDILERKKTSLGYKNKILKKWKNWHFSKGVNPWFWSKITIFQTFFFLGNIGQENVFYDILKRKNAFLAYKKRGSKSPKNTH